MAKTLFQLHKVLWKRMFSENKAMLASTILIGIYALLGLLSLCSLVWLDLSFNGGHYQSITVPVALGLVAYVMVGLVMPAGENQLRVKDLSALPLEFKELRGGLALASLFSTRVWLSAVTTVIYTVVASLQLVSSGIPLAILAFIPAMVLAFVTTIIAGELVTQLGANSDSMRKETKMALTTVGVFLLIIAVIQLPRLENLGVPLDSIGTVLAWTPVGACVGWAMSLANGAYFAAVAQLLIAVATVVGLAWGWQRSIVKQWMNPVAVQSKEKKERNNGAKALRVPKGIYGPAALEFRRSLLYFFRDGRFLATVAMFPILMVFMLWQSEGDMMFSAYLGIVMLGVLGGIAASNDFGYDGPSLWLKMSAPVKPHVFLLARHAAQLLLPVIAVSVMGIGIVVMANDKQVAFAVWLASYGVLASGAAFALALTTFNPYPMSRPGTNPWSDKAGYSSAALMTSIIAILFGWLPAVPGGIMMILFAGSSTVGLFAGAAVAVAVPAVIYAITIVVSIERVDKRMPEIYDKVKTWVS